MKRIEYMAIQDQLVLLARVIEPLDLVDFLNEIEHSETVGPIVDPTLYLQSANKLENVKRLARAALTFQREVRRQMALEVWGKRENNSTNEREKS